MPTSTETSVEGSFHVIGATANLPAESPAPSVNLLDLDNFATDISVSARSDYMENIGTLMQTSCRNTAEIMPLVTRFSNLKIVQNNDKFKQTAITCFFDSMVTFGETLPKQLEVYRSQIAQVQRVLGSRFSEIMADGQIDVEDAQQVLTLMKEQLFNAKGTLGKIQASAKQLKESFNTLDTKEGFMMTVRSEQGRVQTHMTVAKIYAKVYSWLTFAKEEYADFAFVASLAVLVFAMAVTTVAVTLSFVLAFVLAALASWYKLTLFGPGPNVHKASDTIWKPQEKEVKGLLELGTNWHMFITHIDKSISTMHVYANSLDNQVKQIPLLTKNQTNLKRFTVGRLTEYLKDNGLSHVADMLQQRHIDGQTFVNTDIINKTSLEEFGMKDLEIQRVISLQKTAKEGDGLPSAGAKELAKTVTETLAGIQDDASKVERQLMAVLRKC